MGSEKNQDGTKSVASEFLGIPAAANFLQITAGSLYNLKYLGILPCYKPGGKKILFKRSDLQAYIEQGRIASNSEIEAEAAIHSTGRRK